jgi:hypothetical protein
MGIFDRKPNNNITGNEDNETEEEDDDVETYTYEWDCDNCNELYDYDIPLKTRVIDFIKTQKCETCGCKVYDLESRKINISDDEEE